MILWLFHLITQLWFGNELAKFFFKTWNLDFFVVFSLGIPIGFIISTFEFYISSAFFGMNFLHVFIDMILLAVISLILFYNNSHNLSGKNFHISLKSLIIFVFSLSISVCMCLNAYNPKERYMQDVCIVSDFQ